MRYQCKICLKKFIQIGTLKRHCDTHGIPAKNVDDIIIRLNPTNVMVSLSLKNPASHFSADSKAARKRTFLLARFLPKISVAILASAHELDSVLSALFGSPQFYAKPEHDESQSSDSEPVQQPHYIVVTNAEYDERDSACEPSSVFCEVKLELQFLPKPDHPVSGDATVVPTILQSYQCCFKVTICIILQKHNKHGYILYILSITRRRKLMAFDLFVRNVFSFLESIQKLLALF